MRAVATEIGATQVETCLVTRHDSMDHARLHRLARILNFRSSMDSYYFQTVNNKYADQICRLICAFDFGIQEKQIFL